jgi:hypothetical protein
MKVEQNVCVCIGCRTRLEIAERELRELRKLGRRPYPRKLPVLGRPR